ncbi:MAG: amidohydrolase, partial [Alphaproteobacteria bacterium]
MDTFDRAGSGLTEITNATDSREILAHARRQADARNFDDVFIVDVDAHVDDGGNWGQITQFIEDEVVREAANAFGDGSRKGAFLNGVAGLQWQNVWGRIRHGRDQITLPDGSKTAAEIAMARASMGQMAMDYQVIFPRALLFLGMHPVREMEVHLATAYNRWLVECALPQDPRVKAMLYLPFNTPEAAEKTVERFVGKPGVAGFLVTSS